MISTQSYSRPIAIEPKQYQPAVMDKFDKLLLRAAKNKRKDIINRYGEEGCEKLVSKGKQEEKKEDPELVKKKYQETIKKLLQSLEEFPLPKIEGSPLPSCPVPKSPHSTKVKLGTKAISSSYSSPHATKANLDTKAISSAWSWNLSKSPDLKSKRKRAARPKREGSSRRHSLDLKHEDDPISSSERTTSDDSCDTMSSNDSSNTERKHTRTKKKTSDDMLSSDERKARRSRRRELMQRLAQTEARTSAIEQVERGVVEKKNEHYRRGSIGSNAEASRKLQNVRQAVRYWEGRGSQCVKPPRRMSH